MIIKKEQLPTGAFDWEWPTWNDYFRCNGCYSKRHTSFIRYQTNDGRSKKPYICRSCYAYIIDQPDGILDTKVRRNYIKLKVMAGENSWDV